MCYTCIVGITDVQSQKLLQILQILLHTVLMLVMLDPLDSNADLDTTAKTISFVIFHACALQKCICIFGRFDSTEYRAGIKHDKDPR